MVGTTTVTSLPTQLILKRKLEDLDMDRIDDCLSTHGLKSCIIRSSQYLKSHLVVTNCEGVNFGGFVCPYNILTRIQKILKGEGTLEELVKHNKYLAILKISEDESITVYTLSIFSSVLFGGK